jgi:hypothetical protein
MKWLKLTAFTFVFTSIAFLSCKEEDYLVPGEFASTNLPMSGAQEVPAVTTGATGTIQATYSQYSKTLNYTVTFSGLSGNAAAAHIHGTGEPGINAVVLQTFAGFPAKTAGTYSGSLLIDGVKILEEYLLAGKYYINIHTAANPGGEIRGQLILTKQ